MGFYFLQAYLLDLLMLLVGTRVMATIIVEQIVGTRVMATITVEQIVGTRVMATITVSDTLV